MNAKPTVTRRCAPRRHYNMDATVAAHNHYNHNQSGDTPYVAHYSQAWSEYS
jgi:hypothetical protein